MKLSLGSAAAAAAATAGFAGLSSIASKERKPGVILNKAPFVYIANDKAKELNVWFFEKVGQEARLEDFDEPGKGATTTWNGFPAILLRLDRSKMKPPPGKVTNSRGKEYELADLSGIESDIAAFWAICPHACCRPDWRISRPDSPLLWCICHSYQAEPHAIVWDIYPPGTRTRAGGIKYRGAMWEGGPGERALPLIPVQIERGAIFGIPTELDAYRYCGINLQ